MKLGYEVKTGDVVDIPVTHTVFSALTGGGKTEAVLRLVTEAAKLGYTVLAIDVKAKPRDFDGVGKEIRPILIESTDALLVMRMLESIAGAGLFSKFSAILDASVDAEDLKDVLKSLEAIRDNKKAWSRKRDDAKILAYLLSKLLEQIREGHYAQDLAMTDPGVYVMNISDLPLGVQELVVDSVFRRLLTGEWKKTVVVLEEAINFIPQSEATTFETSARKFIREGRSAELFLWASGQALTEMDIAVRKQMRVWILGPQMEEREAEKFRKQVPMKGVDAHEIQRLPTGHFIGAIRRSEEEGGQVEVKRVYAQPVWLPDAVAIKIATGVETLKDAMRFKRAQKLRKEGRKAKDMDESERKKYERQIEEQNVTIERLDSRRADLEGEVQDLRREVAELKSVPAKEAYVDFTPTSEQAERQRAKQHSEKIPAIVEGDIDLETLATKVTDMVMPKVLARIPRGQVVEVPPKRVILSTFLEGHVQRVKEPITKLPDRAKRYLAMLSTKEGWQGTKSVAVALFGYGSDAATIAKSIAETGAIEYDSQHGRVRYALLENLKKDLQGTYEITDRELEDIHTALQHEFLGMLAKG